MNCLLDLNAARASWDGSCTVLGSLQALPAPMSAVATCHQSPPQLSAAPKPRPTCQPACCPPWRESATDKWDVSPNWPGSAVSHGLIHKTLAKRSQHLHTQNGATHGSPNSPTRRQNKQNLHEKQRPWLLAEANGTKAVSSQVIAQARHIRVTDLSEQKSYCFILALKGLIWLSYG